jgi:two-component system copper resistance phosphate regulon response regulator CusR
MMRILLVEDDKSLADLVRTGLEEQNIRVTLAHTFENGKTEAVLGTFDVIVLDVMLPGGSGFDSDRRQASPAAGGSENDHSQPLDIG